jgi:hypothetical protein
MSSRLRTNVPCKPHRVSPRTPGRFGKGLTAFIGQNDGHKPYSVADLDWAAAAFSPAAQEARLELEAREMEAERWAIERMEAGLPL